MHDLNTDLLKQTETLEDFWSTFFSVTTCQRNSNLPLNANLPFPGEKKKHKSRSQQMKRNLCLVGPR